MKKIYNFIIPLLILVVTSASAQQTEESFTVNGTVIDSETNEALIGVTVMKKGTREGTVTNVDGTFSIMAKSTDTLAITYIGYMSETLPVGNQTNIKVSLNLDVEELAEVVVVGYGVQERKSVVGSIATTTNKRLEQTGNPTNLAQSLTGQLPGVTTLQSTGEPGNDQTNILIRGTSTWNGAGPLILVDGIERPLNDIDVSEVASVSVLKDASATAVYGILGANGVILVTTKGGERGKAKLNLTYNAGLKFNSKLPQTLDSYNARLAKNQGIENELPVNENSWGDYTPSLIVDQWLDPERNQDLYPNVDWQDEVLKDVALSHRVNLSVSGGSDFVKYFSALTYTHDADLYKQEYNDEFDFKPSFAYDRVNYRSNLDFSITNTTKLKLNLFGYTGFKKRFTESGFNENAILFGIYKMAPDVMPVRYSDGTYSFYYPEQSTVRNPVQVLNESGINRSTRTQLGSNFELEQKLDFITKGLKIGGKLAYDLYYQTNGRNLDIPTTQSMYIDPITLDTNYSQVNGQNEYDFVTGFTNLSSESFDVPGFNNNRNASARNLYYEFNLNYAQTFGNHNVTGLALFNRRQDQSGVQWADRVESWAYRLTYNFKDRYLVEFNGAYNGSDQFGQKYRFDFFPSFAFGWNLAQENFMQGLDWLEVFKLRYSWGKVGSYRGIPKYSYQSSWIFGGSLDLGAPFLTNRPYPFFSEGTIGNPNLRWEVATKQNFGLEIEMLSGAIMFEADYFIDNRDDIFMNANERNIPIMFGANPVAANLGKTETKGVELQISLNHTMGNGLNIWTRANWNHAVDKVIFREDPELLDNYLKQAGYQIGQTRSLLHSGLMNNWDDVYASAETENNMNIVLPGDADIIDFNADGIINNFDNAPYGFPSRPQTNYSIFLGANYKGFSFMMQFYGVNNINKSYALSVGTVQTLFFEDFEDYWTPNRTDARFPGLRWQTRANPSNRPDGLVNMYDASYIKLKTAEIAYTLPSKLTQKAGIDNLRIFVNGNNLFFWSNLPQDTEVENLNTQQQIGFYPLFRKVNLGVSFQF